MSRNKFIPIMLVAVLVIAGVVYTTYAPESNIETYPTEAEKITDAPVTEENHEVAEDKKVDNTLDFNVNLADDKYSTLNSKNTGWGFKKQKGLPPDIYNSTQKMFEEYNTYYMDKRGGKVLYLTFDEGYENGYTANILDVLKEKQVPAAFFVTGPYLKKQTELVDRMVNEGHIVGNHTVNHPNLAKADLKTVYDELNGLNEIYKEKYGENMTYMRPPEGEYSEKLLSYVSDMGYKTILWSFAYRDWEVDNQKGEQYAFDQVTPYLHDGAIVLLHAVSADNAKALGRIIDYAREQGYVFKSLDDMFK